MSDWGEIDWDAYEDEVGVWSGDDVIESMEAETGMDRLFHDVWYGQGQAVHPSQWGGLYDGMADGINETWRDCDDDEPRWVVAMAGVGVLFSIFVSVAGFVWLVAHLVRWVLR